MNKQQPFQQQKKSPLRWLWIPFAVVGGIVLIIVGYYTLLAGAFLIADPPSPTVEGCTECSWPLLQRHTAA